MPAGSPNNTSQQPRQTGLIRANSNSTTSQEKKTKLDADSSSSDTSDTSSDQDITDNITDIETEVFSTPSANNEDKDNSI